MFNRILCRLGVIFVCLAIFACNILAQSYTQSGGSATLSGKTYTTSTADESGVLVKNSGTLNLSNSIISTSGNTSNSDNSSFYGLNAAVLATSSSSITLTDCNVTSTGKGANGVFAYGSGANITVSGGSVNCSGQYAHAVMTSGGGLLKVTNLNMITTGANSGAIATDRGGGTITVTGGTVKTSGADAPGIYSTGTITVSDADIKASNSEGAVIEGLNNVILNNTTLSGSSSNYGSVLIVQSMSGDASSGTSKFTMTGGSLTSLAGPSFFITNNDAVVKLTNVSLTASNGNIAQARATSRWGTTGKNGGILSFTADTQVLNGNFVIDSLSKLDLTLQNSSTLTGAINNKNSAVSATLTMDSNSKWILTAKSYLSAISNSVGISGTNVTNITGNGYNVYYNSSLSSNSYLGAKTYTLINGGYLLPLGANSTEGTNTNSIKSFSLDQNYPNPFNPSTTINYTLPYVAKVELKIYDIAGNEIRTLVNSNQNAGIHSVNFNAGELSSGIYLARIVVGKYSKTIKMNLLK